MIHEMGIRELGRGVGKADIVGGTKVLDGEGGLEAVGGRCRGISLVKVDEGHEVVVLGEVEEVVEGIGGQVCTHADALLAVELERELVVDVLVSADGAELAHDSVGAPGVVAAAEEARVAALVAGLEVVGERKGALGGSIVGDLELVVELDRERGNVVDSVHEAHEEAAHEVAVVAEVQRHAEHVRIGHDARELRASQVQSAFEPHNAVLIDAHQVRLRAAVQAQQQVAVPSVYRCSRQPQAALSQRHRVGSRHVVVLHIHMQHLDFACQ